MDSLKLLINRLLGRPTTIEVDLLGQPVKLDIVARRELRRARKISHETDLVERMREYLTDGDVVYDVIQVSSSWSP